LLPSDLAELFALAALLEVCENVVAAINNTANTVIALFIILKFLVSIIDLQTSCQKISKRLSTTYNNINKIEKNESKIIYNIESTFSILSMLK
jgi:hypothetical protein